MTAFSLLPTDAQFYDIEQLCRILPSPVTDEPSSPASVDRQLYASLLQLLACVRRPEFDTHSGWDGGLKLAAVRRLEDTGLRYDILTNMFIATDKTVDVRLGRATKLPPVSVDAMLTGGNEDAKRDVSRSSMSSAPSAGGLTLDDIQQVLSAANCPLPGVMSNSVTYGAVTGGADSAADERAVEEITAYLQSEISGNRVSQDAASTHAPSDLCGYNARGASTVTDHNSGLVVRLIPPGSHHEPRGTNESSRDESSRLAADAGGTILVTDSNLPYLQQFLPNLQTVMQSVQSLVRCAPQSAGGSDITVNSVASGSQQRSMSVPSLATSKNSDTQYDSHKKRKRSGHANQTNVAPAGNAVASLKELTSKPGDPQPGKMEPDSATLPSRDGAFTCGLCSRTFSKRLGLSVHIQRAHGHRRSSESVESTHEAGLHVGDKATQDEANVKNCFVKMAKLDGRESQSCMCDGCGEIVSALDTHVSVCVGRQSPTKFAGQDGVMKVEKCESVSANTAVVEMLQLAEHFLRQHVPTAPVSEQTQFVEQADMMSPPPYTSTSNMMPAALRCANGPVAPAELPTHSGAAVAQPPGKEIIYEGSRMREFVEYQCEACLLTFSSSSLANSHVSDHHTSASLSAYRVYACLSCSLRYRDPRIMRHHVVYLCGGTGSQTDAPSNHQLYPCSFCPKTFMSAEYMQLHVRLRHTTQPATTAVGPVPCVLPTPPGSTSVPSLEQLVSHFQRHPASVNQPATSSIISTVNHESSTGRKEAQSKAAVTSVTHGLLTDVDGCNAVRQTSVIDGRQLTTAQSTCEPGKSRSSKAKGILYKNVFMQCEGTYYCSVCHADLTGRESKRRHRQLPCGDPKTASYSRRYSYVCPYCSERFPSQKLCRQHQIDECLPLIGVGTAELGVGEHRCPLCPKTCFGFPALKGHMMQAHHLRKEETHKLLAEHELVVPTCVDNGQELNGVLSPAVSSPSSTLSTTSSAFVTPTTASPGVHCLYESTVTASHADGVESDDEISDRQQHKDLFPQLYESIVTDDGPQCSDDATRPKRNRKSRSNEFFVMMFRNYPILAKGVSMCRSCAGQLEANASTESHAATCSGSAAPDVRRSTLFRCTHCPATFWRAKDCRTHQLESCLPAHGIKIEHLTQPSVACPLCDVRSYNRSGLMSHMKFRHSLDTDGVRQLMDRCGIRKSVPPAVATSPLHCEDGSLSMDDMDGATPMQHVSATESTSAVSELAVVSNDGSVADNINTWPTANMLLEQTSTSNPSDALRLC